MLAVFIAAPGIVHGSPAIGRPSACPILLLEDAYKVWALKANKPKNSVIFKTSGNRKAKETS